MSTKNPFEIRTELLQMAKDYLDQQWHANLDFARQTFDRALEAGKVGVEDWRQYMPQAYTIDELTKKAQELYGFVEKK